MLSVAAGRAREHPALCARGLYGAVPVDEEAGLVSGSGTSCLMRSQLSGAALVICVVAVRLSIYEAPAASVPRLESPFLEHALFGPSLGHAPFHSSASISSVLRKKALLQSVCDHPITAQISSTPAINLDVAGGLCLSRYL